MPSFERGVYEPPSDDIHVFDEDEDMDEEGSRLPLLIVIALLVLAAFAGVVWLAYSQGVQRGRSDAPRLIVAAAGPTKEAAPNSAASGDHGSLKIYQQQAPADEDTDSVPPPPTEVVKSATPPSATATASPMTAAPSPVVTKPVEKPVVAAAKPVVVAKSPAPAALKPAVPTEKPDKKPTVTASVPAETPKAVATAAPTPLSPTRAPVAETPKPAAAPSSGAYALQIGAYKSQAEADAAWKSYAAKHPIAGGYSEDVRKADLSDKGTWYRLRIGSFGDKAAATAFCDKLKADGGNCFLAK
jgi:cell division protein FtsN